ncbi:MAG TPA: SHOCT domain-containing protein [Candidatus Saccharimonadales bacterium]|nr:SHOCT domain-containing protein [Candidatus Saccharimonadales bacterium]
MMYGWGDNSGYDVWGFIFMLLMMALVILGIIVAVRYLGRDTRSNHTEETALDVLKKRYAKGDIDKKEYEEKRKDLES